MTTDTFYLGVSDGTSVAVHRWTAEAEPKAIIQISHGMAEYARRYDRFAAAAAARGFTVYAADHRGHGQTAGSLDRLGYLADRDGFVRVMEDQHELTLEIRKNHPGVPIVLLGHSFGSFIAQMYIERYGTLLAGCVLSGTRGPDPVTVIPGKILAALVCLFGNPRKKSHFLANLSFGSNNRRIPDAASPNAWLSRDAKEVELYDDTPWAGFTCTAGFFRDLTHGLSAIHAKKALAGIPCALPVFIASGAEDPVGNYGKTPTALAEIYRRLGLVSLKFVLYPGARHEILNETNRDEVSSDIFGWIDSILPARNR